MNPKIEKATIDGHDRVVLLDDDNVVGYPNGLAIDYEENRLYWADGKDKRIMSCDLNGQSVRIVQTSLQQPFGLTLLEDWLFWTDWGENGVMRMNKHGKYKQAVVSQLTHATPKDVKVVHPLRQPVYTTVPSHIVHATVQVVVVQATAPVRHPPSPTGSISTADFSVSGSTNTGIIAGVVSGGVVFLVMMLIIAAVVHGLRNQKHREMSMENPLHYDKDNNNHADQAVIGISIQIPNQERVSLPAAASENVGSNGTMV